jgi:hypothetical protein
MATRRRHQPLGNKDIPEKREPIQPGRTGSTAKKTKNTAEWSRDTTNSPTQTDPEKTYSTLNNTNTLWVRQKPGNYTNHKRPKFTRGNKNMRTDFNGLKPHYEKENPNGGVRDGPKPPKLPGERLGGTNSHQNSLDVARGIMNARKKQKPTQIRPKNLQEAPGRP